MKKFLMLGALSFLFSFQFVSAAAGDVEGYAWGGGVNSNPAGYDGIGWISMNSTGCDTDKNTFPDVACGGNNTSGVLLPYAVNIPSSDGNLSGYAWSEHYGWISFNPSDVVGCPSGGICDARRVGDNILGWARIFSIPALGVNAGGWSGWISLNSKNCDTDSNSKTDVACGGDNTNTVLQPYGLQVSKMAKRAWNDNDPLKTTYAYSDELGWIDFSTAGFGNTLKICEGSSQRTLGTNIPLSSGGATTLTARYGTGDCSTDPLVGVTWSTELNPDDAIDLSFPAGNNPVDTVGVTAHVTTPSRSENVVATCGASSCGAVVVEKALARVTCPTLCSSLSAQTNAYCPSDTRNLNNACGGTISCQGTKDCSYNFKEVNP